MSFSDIVKEVLLSSPEPLTPQDIKNIIKAKYPTYYGTESHIRNVEKGYYKDIDHALLAQIYTLVGTSDTFRCDKTIKPMRISLAHQDRLTERRHKLIIDGSGHKTSAKGDIKYEERVKDILENAEKYHAAFYKAETFRGPSLYFHQRAIATRLEPLSLVHLEYVYATLSAWGMNRMGKGGSKMQSFDTFCRSIEPLQNHIAQAQQYDIQNMSNNRWKCLEEIFCGINVMASGTSLVGNSKVMHHMLPNIIPPIDREYTLWYLRGNTSIKNDLEYEWSLMKTIISDFFIPVASNKEYQLKAATWLACNSEYPWDTSSFKIIDNLIIGSKK